VITNFGITFGFRKTTAVDELVPPKKFVTVNLNVNVVPSRELLGITASESVELYTLFNRSSTLLLMYRGASEMTISHATLAQGRPAAPVEAVGSSTMLSHLAMTVAVESEACGAMGDTGACNLTEDEAA